MLRCDYFELCPFKLTPALKQYINEKLTNTLSKVGRLVTRCDAHLTVDKNPSVENNANFEVVVSVKGTVMRASKSTHDMYASIDAVADSVKRKLRKYKERIIDAHRQGKPEAIGFDEEEIQSFKDFAQEVAKMDSDIPVPPADMSLMKKKTFPMDPISVEEAVLCLDYIEHDFYVFKNKENGKIAVVYKRNHGGVGLIEPQ
eukprot:759717-Hanusia_phi.AAC.7